MLTEKEQTYQTVVALLNSEACSPLKGMIIMDGERIIGGFKAKQLINILYKADIKNIGSTPLTDEKMLTLISEYLCGWEAAVGTRISDRDKEYGPFSKIEGLKFMLLMLPAFYHRAVADKELLKKKYVAEKIHGLFAREWIAARDLFDKQSEHNLYASDATFAALSKTWANKLLSGSFDPLA